MSPDTPRTYTPAHPYRSKGCQTQALNISYNSGKDERAVPWGHHGSSGARRGWDCLYLCQQTLAFPFFALPIAPASALSQVVSEPLPCSPCPSFEANAASELRDCARFLFSASVFARQHCTRLPPLVLFDSDNAPLMFVLMWRSTATYPRRQTRGTSPFELRSSLPPSQVRCKLQQPVPPCKVSTTSPEALLVTSKSCSGQLTSSASANSRTNTGSP